MRVAVLAPVAWRTPPRKYGPWEQVASNVTEGLVKRGLEVTLFATGDSLTQGTLEFVCDRSYEEDPDSNPKVYECLHISHLMEMAGQFDIIHNHFDFLPLTYSRLINTPILTTIHGFSSPSIIPVYKKYNDTNYYVSISNADRSSQLKYMATVYNGLKVEDFTFNPNTGDYLLFFGRIHHDKGAYEAIQIAIKTGMKLIISGFIQDEEYFQEKIAPYLDDDRIQYIGNSGPKKRDEVLGGAYALLHPINFEEPFGLSVVESMLCGTPVVAFNKGSMPELILENKTGFLVKNVDQAVDRFRKLNDLNRKDCRQWAISQFSQDKMVDDYIKLYHRILN